MVTITFDPINVITWAVVGLLAGLLANWLMRGSGRLGSSLLIGLIGAVIGNLIVSFLNVQIGPPLNAAISIRLFDVIVAFISAVILLFILTRIIRGR
jgi:uncharacterized membrane protein YeaQ/YmgE (transglycosylase-associated protein family)